MGVHELQQLFTPNSVAVIGASATRGTMGNITLKNFIDLKFQGGIYPVNPRYDEIEGLRCYASLKDIPDPVEMALVIVSGKFVEDAIQQAVEKKVKYVVVYSSGFAETGEEGKKRQEHLINLCRENHIRLLGPNTMGIYNIKDKLLLSFASSENIEFKSGCVGVVSQSGGFGGIVQNLAVQDEGIGLTYVGLTGNQADLNTIDFLDFMVEDEETKVISAYLEGIPDGEKLKKVADKALRAHKPLIVLKSGTSDVGKKAALSHTASLTGSDETFRVVAKQKGITLVKDFEDMIDAVKAFNSGKRPKGKRVGIISISGATAIMASDNCDALGLEVVAFQESTIEKIKGIVPPFGSPVNPIDMTAMLGQQVDMSERCLEVLHEAEEVDAILMSIMASPEMAAPLVEGILKVNRVCDKPIAVAFHGPEEALQSYRKQLNEAGIPTFNSLWRAAKVIQTLVQYEDMYNQKQLLTANEVAAARETIALTAVKVVNEPDVKQILKKFDISIPNGRVCTNIDEALIAANELNYPVAAKIVSEDVTHKSDVGGVLLNIKNETELKEAYGKIVSNISQNVPSAKIEGVLFEEMAKGPFLEVFVGVKRDPQYGPVMLCGLGGIYVEIMKDIARRLAPISEMEALQMVEELKSYPLFQGARTGIKYDVGALVKALVKISTLVMSIGDNWTELEINPLIVFPEGQGVLALDGLITISDASQAGE